MEPENPYKVRTATIVLTMTELALAMDLVKKAPVDLGMENRRQLIYDKLRVEYLRGTAYELAASIKRRDGKY